VGWLGNVRRDVLEALSMVGVRTPTQDYKYLREPVMICATMVNTQTQTALVSYYPMSE